MLELIGLLEWARGTGLERLVGLKQIGRIGRISKDRVNYIGLEGLAEFSMVGSWRDLKDSQDLQDWFVIPQTPLGTHQTPL